MQFDFAFTEGQEELLPAVDAKRGLAVRITTTGETEKQYLVTMTEGSTILRQYSFTSRQEAEDEAQRWAEQMKGANK